jgi:hypothetical protein
MKYSGDGNNREGHLTEEDKRYIRAGYYRTHKNSLSYDDIENMSQRNREHYYLVAESAFRKEKYLAILGWAVSFIIVVGIFAVTKIHSHSVKKAEKDVAAVAGCYTALQASNHIGESGCVDFHVSYVYETSAGTKFVDQYQDYARGFVGYIPYNSSAESDINLSDYSDKDVRVSGNITTYKGYTEIEIDNNDQVSLQ